mgnify:CR=1 FL=1
MRRHALAAAGVAGASVATFFDQTLDFVDRVKYLVKSGGENVYPAEIERVILQDERVIDVAVVRKPDPKWGEVPVAYVELKPGKTATEDEIIAHCRALLARFKVPKAILFGDIPKTSTGKIQKFQLRELAKVG